MRLCDASGLRAIGAALPGGQRTTRAWRRCSYDPRVEAVAIATPVVDASPDRAARVESRQARVRREAAGRVVREAVDADRARAGVRARADARATRSSTARRSTIRTLIDSGEIGDIYFVSTSRVNLGLHQTDVSVAWDLGPHDFSILRYWLGETPDVSARSAAATSCPATPDVAFIDLEFPSETIAHVELPGSPRASCGERRSSARARWSSTTTRAPSRCGFSIRGSSAGRPRPSASTNSRYRTGDIVSLRVNAAEPLSVSRCGTSAARVRPGRLPLVCRARPRGRADDRSGRRLPQPGGCTRSSRSERSFPGRTRCARPRQGAEWCLIS